MGTRVCISLAVLIIRAVFGQKILQIGYAVAGQPLTMECRITRPPDDRNELVWGRLDNLGGRMTVYASRHCDDVIPLSGSSFPGFSGSCDVINGEEVYRLTIANVTEDMGHFTWGCHFRSLFDDVQLDVKAMVKSVTLLPPSSPLVAGCPSTFTCVTPPSKPSACIRWFIGQSGSDRELTHGSAVCNQDSGAPQPTIDTLKFSATAEDNGARLHCTANNRVTDIAVRSRDYALNVQYPPQPGISLSGYGGSALESGDRAVMSCTVGKGNPRPTLTWSSVCGGNTVPGNDGRQRVSLTVTPSLNGKSCVCRGSQPGSRTGWIQEIGFTFTVFYPPEVKVVVKNVDDIREGTTLEMECRVTDGNPQNYTLSPWTHHIGKRLIELRTTGTGRRLQISDAQFQDQGVYTCGASNGVGGVQRGSREVKIKGTPKFPFAETVVHTDLGDVITLSAGFVAYPVYKNITWHGVVDGGEEIIKLSSMFGNKYRQRVRETMVNFTLYGTAVQVMGHEVELTITNPDRQDFINYTLCVDNEMGTSRHVFTLFLKTEDPSTETQSEVPTSTSVPVVIYILLPVAVAVSLGVADYI